MADYFTLFSFLVSADPAAGWVQELSTLLDACADGTVPPDHPFGDAVGEVWGLPLVEVTSDGLWFHDDGGHSVIETTISVVQWVLAQPGTPTEIEFAWADSCSRPVLDAYGGGAAKVNRYAFATVHTSGTTIAEILSGDLDDLPEPDDDEAR